jgi:PAS domain S-box-containing protein
MAGQWTPFFVPLLGGAGILLGLAVLAFKNRDTRGATPLGGYLVATGLYNVCYALQLWTTTPEGSLFWAQMQVPMWSSAAVFGFLFGVEYTNREQWLRRARAGALFVPPAIATVLFFLHPELFFANIRMREELSLVIMAADKQAGWWLTLAYAYGAVLLGFALISLRFLRSIRVGQFRGQALLLIGGYSATIGSNALQNSLGFQVSFASLGFAVTGIVVYLAVFRFGLFSSVPVARRKVLADMADGFLVVGSGGRIIDANQQAREIFGGEPVVDEPIDAVYPAYERVVRDQGDGHASHECRRRVGDRDRFFDVQTSPVAGIRGRVDAHVVRFTDITERKERERELEATKRELERSNEKLERSNEKLERFAGMVSHDLRNPLAVIKGRADFLRAEAPDEHVEPILRSTERMETMIEDLLTLSRAGESVDDPEPVSLATVVDDSWAAVSSDDVDLEVEIPADVEVEADGDRLQHVFENLFRNASEHNDTPVTVRVGALSDGTGSVSGFFVADDGTGIPESVREDVFEQGYTTNTDGTGFGLSIAEEIVEAHGWSISVGESDAGGARFDVHTTDQS